MQKKKKGIVTRSQCRDLSRIALFGLIDGLNGMVGLVIGLARVHARAPVIFTAVLAVAAANAVSMAGAQYGSDTTDRQLRAGQPRDSTTVRWFRTAAMGAGYLVSALLPGFGFAFGTTAGWSVLIPAVVVLLVGITLFRAQVSGWKKATATTLVIFVLAVGVAFLASLTG